MIGQKLVGAVDVPELATEYEDKSAEELIRWTLSNFGHRSVISTSFQAEGMVVVDLAYHIDPDVRLFTIDTGRLPQETYDLIDRVREHYGVTVEVFYPDQDELTGMVSEHGINPFYRAVALRLGCCEIRKVNPMKRALSNVDAWVTGLRRGQSGTRADISKIEIDSVHGGIVKVNPLADWDDDQVWDYIMSRDVPYNELFDKGYTSIGCAPCTRPTKPGEDPRAGRWWWEDRDVPKECGIHGDLLASLQLSDLPEVDGNNSHR